LGFIPPGKPCDFEIFMAMLAIKHHGYLMGPDESLLWIDTLEDLAHSNALLTKEILA
jgi:hypothetical protein